MFLVTDSIETRQRKIRQFLRRGEPAIAVLLAAADCERTMRRAILSLGTTPTRELAHRLGRKRPKGYVAPAPTPPHYGSSIKGYAKAWKQEVSPFWGLELKGDVIEDWDSLAKAFQLRHDLIHGDTGTTGQDYAEVQVEALLAATERVHKAAFDRGYDLEKPLRRRLRPRAKAK